MTNSSNLLFWIVPQVRAIQPESIGGIGTTTAGESVDCGRGSGIAVLAVSDGAGDVIAGAAGVACAGPAVTGDGAWLAT
jgi:hypothetical protein